PPPPSWLRGKWHVTHSTLPMWKSKRNVTITYTPLPSSSDQKSPHPHEPTLPLIDDLVEYQSLSNAKIKSVHGVDTPVEQANGWAWAWRGKGWLKIASSQWEALGYGDEPGTATPGTGGEGEDEGRQWVVTYFAKTLFTPAGIDLYARHPGGLKSETVENIKEELGKMEDAGLRELAGTLFEVKMDGAR
ncbi:hypothetical protein K490DRAFT_2708, partial [Saccharata proteae CBS 121410]